MNRRHGSKFKWQARVFRACFVWWPGVRVVKHSLVNMIDAAVEADAARGQSFRSHLGGSLIGRKCERDIWYSFRWAATSNFKGRMLRLFNRGHLEEFRFVNYLKMAGIEVQAYSQRLLYHPESDSYATEDWDHDLTGAGADRMLCEDVTDEALHVARAEGRGVRLQQWRIKSVMGHFGGSLDGIARNLPGAPNPDTEALLEFKTHNAKSFIKLEADGVLKAKPEHYAQMQIYMHHKELPFAIYMAVNKNDDDMHVEVVEYDRAFALELLDKAKRIIEAREPPPRIGNHPSWYECKFCNHSDVCHFGKPMHKSCRSCVFAKAVDGGEWACDKFGGTIPAKFVPQGCDHHKPITD